MARSPKNRQKPSARRVVITVISLVVIVVAIIAATSGGGKKTPSGPFTGSAAKLKAATTAAVDNASASPGLAKSPAARCVSQHVALTCIVAYAIKEPAGINYGNETILPTTGVFQYAFTDPNVSSVIVSVGGPVTSVGGKSSVSQLFSLACSKRAASQIDWSTVSVSGLKQLCSFQQFVNNP